jgi:hypothetical protein
MQMYCAFCDIASEFLNIIYIYSALGNLVLPSQYHSTNTPDLSSSYYYTYRDSGQNLETLKQSTVYKRVFTSVFNVLKYCVSFLPIRRISFISVSSLLACAFRYQTTACGHVAFVFRRNRKAI